jgi:hypothetical protein
VKQLRWLMAIACASFWIPPCNAEGVVSEPAQASSPFEVLSIDDAVKAAIDHNLNLLAARANVTIAEAQMITARLRPNPVISGSADTLDWLGTRFTEANGLGPSLFAFRIDVPFEHGGKRELRTQTASFERQIAEAEIADAVRRLRLDVMVACIDLLEAKAKLQLARDNLNTFEQLVQVNQCRLTSGAIPPIELTRVRVAMLQYRNTERAAELTVVQARVRLMPLLGRTAEQPPVDIDGDLSVKPEAGPPGLDTLQQLARQARPDLTALRQEQARSQADRHRCSRCANGGTAERSHESLRSPVRRSNMAVRPTQSDLAVSRCVLITVRRSQQLSGCTGAGSFTCLDSLHGHEGRLADGTAGGHRERRWTRSQQRAGAGGIHEPRRRAQSIAWARTICSARARALDDSAHGR